MLIIEYLSAIDWIVILLTLLAAMLIGYRAKNHHSTNTSYEYLLMGKQLSLPMFIGTLVATWYGGILGVTQIAFEQGMYNFISQGICWYFAYLLFAFIMVKKIRHMQVNSFSEIIANMIGDKAGKIAAWILLIKTLPAAYAISIAIILQYLIPMPLSLAIAVGLILCLCYMYRSGFRAVVYTDFFQFIIMSLAVIGVLICSWYKFGSHEYLLNNLPSSHFAVTGNRSLGAICIWFLIACSTTFLNPTFYQRCIAAKNDHVAMFGIIIATIIWLLFDICTTLGGMYAKAYLPEFASEHAYMHYSMQILPHGLKGLFIAGLFAAAFSTLDSFLFICGNIISHDLQLIKISNIKHAHQHALLIATAATLAISLCFNTNIEAIWISMKMYFIISLLVPLIICYIFPKIINDTKFIIWIILVSIFSIIHLFRYSV